MSILDKGAPLPNSLGGCTDLLHDLSELRLMMKAEMDKIAARETEVREHLIDNLSKSNNTGIAGLRYRAQISTSAKFSVKDWGILRSWIRKNDAFDFLGKSLNQTAAAEWCEANDRILPGCERVWVPKLSVTKIPGA